MQSTIDVLSGARQRLEPPGWGNWQDVAVVEKVMRATPERIFAVLSDGWSYSNWVVGTAHVRDVDTDWPAPGANLYHQVAGWPLRLKDKTVVLASDPPRELVLQPHLWPLGELTVRITLTPLNDTETKVTLAEDVAAGPAKWLRTKAEDLLMHYRNKEALRRLDDLVTRKQKP